MTRRKSARGKAGAVFSWPQFGQWLPGLILFSLIGAGLLWGVTLLTNPNRLPLRVVRIDGEFRHLQRVELERAVSRAAEGNFFTIDVEHIRESARRVPWVDRVSVRRIWPDTLHMRVVEQMPLARWGKASLVNSKGERFTPPLKEIPAGLPQLEGPAGSEGEVVSWYRSIVPHLRSIGLEIALLRLDARRAWSIAFHQGMQIRLGNSDVESRLRRFIRLYPYMEQDKQRSVKRMDLRYTNGFAVYWSELKEPVSGLARISHQASPF